MKPGRLAAIERPPLVMVSKVVKLDIPPELAGAELDLPLSGMPSDVYSMTLEGWAVGRDSPAIAIVVTGEGYQERSLPFAVRRPDLPAQYPHIEWACNGGFRAGISSLLLPETFDLAVSVLLADGTSIPLARVSGRRRRLDRIADDVMKPIIVTTLGRTGSTMVTSMLGAHAQIVAFRPFTYEPRVASYWAEILATLAEPQSYLQAMAGEVYGWDWWAGQRRMSPQEEMVKDPDVELFLGRDQVEEMSAFCRNRIAAFYEHVGRAKGGFPRYFVEKCWPGASAPTVLRQFYPGTKEIFLMRDPRDIAASTLAYNHKRGFPSFGRETVETDEDYIRIPLARASRDLLEAWRERPDSYLLRYEDLIEWPRETLTDLLEHLGLDSDPATVDTTLRGSHPAGLEAEHQTSPSAAASIGRWRQLPDDLRVACDEALGDTLVQFGYQR